VAINHLSSKGQNASTGKNKRGAKEFSQKACRNSKCGSLTENGSSKKIDP
jgi:hypothetical protein